MADPKAQSAQQLKNILQSTGKTVAEFVGAVQAEGLTKHGQMLKFFKTTYGLGHGNANLLAHTVREVLAGGPADPQALLNAQYDGAKAALRPIYEALAAIGSAQGADVSVIFQKTGVSFRRGRQFMLVQAPSSKRVQLGLNLAETPDGGRVVAMRGMCSHKSNLTGLDQVDAEVRGWIEAAYAQAGG